MRRSAFRQADLTKALKAAKAAGENVARIEIAPDGTMVVVLTRDGSAQELSMSRQKWDDMVK